MGLPDIVSVEIVERRGHETWAVSVVRPDAQPEERVTTIPAGAPHDVQRQHAARNH